MPFSVPLPGLTDTLINGEQHTRHSIHRSENEEATESIESQQERNESIARLASRISSIAPTRSPFYATSGSPLDPQGPSFNPAAWMKAFYSLHLNDTDLAARNRGIAFRNLSVHGFGTATDFQRTVGNVFLNAVPVVRRVLGHKGHKVNILRNLDGVVDSGELLCVLGPPGSGCSTFLKTIAGETHGLYLGDKAYLNYKGITPQEMKSQFRGEATFTAEDDAHLPTLSVGDTLNFAALARSPRDLPDGMGRNTYATHLSEVLMAAFGISHTRSTRVGDNFIRGVSGGERKRVSIAEAILSDAPLQCWDNSTRGLDSANAIEFCKALRLCSDVFGTTSVVAIYQAPQAAYNFFDKVLVLYEGRQIYFGRAADAQHYFERLGFICPDNQTTPDFLTSMTSPSERVIRPGYEKLVPRSSEDFVMAWTQSEQRQQLSGDIDRYAVSYPFKGNHLEAFAQVRKQEQARLQRVGSPYTLSYFQQFTMCLRRGFKLLRGDPSITLVQLAANFVQFLIAGSVFYNLGDSSDSLYFRGMIIFTSLILNAFASILEILTLYAKRRVVEKHNRFALYHPSAEALAAMVVDLPYKIVNSVVVNTTVYFMANLRREAGPYFFFLLISFASTLTMSMLFRLIGSTTKTASQALAPTAVILLAIVLFTGFAIPTNAMLGWCRWINYLSPMAWSFESLMINELAGRTFACSQLVPSGPGYDGGPLASRSCNVVGASAGTNLVSGTRHLKEAFNYIPSHRWRNFGVLIAFMVLFLLCNLISSELVTSAKSNGEVLIFQRGQLSRIKKIALEHDLEGTNAARPVVQNSKRPVQSVLQQTSVFHWRNVCYDVKIKDENRRILDHVSGWVKPGTLTALMGVSGAGKTTLLDALASRLTMGVVSGEMLVNGRLRDDSFQRKTGYVQQQDLHLSTATVREALTFSALLRQPASTAKQEKLDYVEEVIDLLEMREFADAVIGEVGEGLNVEQRKRLTIGVELAAKPQLLLFLDEPTSGLDSQTSWSICALMRKLVNHGQAILCTIHQPSAMLFDQFDRLLLLARGGRTVYFGEIGQNSRTLVDYFVRNGAEPCAPGTNPAEWMLATIGAAPGVTIDTDWSQIWQTSHEKQLMDEELQKLASLARLVPDQAAQERANGEFAAPLVTQVLVVTKRIFQQYWRSPAYIYSKAFLGIGSMIFIGFVFFQSNRSQQGVRSQLFGIFALLTTFMSFVEQTIPYFVVSRSLYEIRERPSKTYSWKAFMLASILVEMPWNLLIGTGMFLSWWFPIGLYHNTAVTDTTNSRAILAFLILCTYMLFTSSFSIFMIAGISSAEAASNLANVLGFVMLIFCGIMATPTFMPGFWIFMYRVNPFTYLSGGLLASGLARAPVYCADREWLSFSAPRGLSCAEYMSDYMAAMGGQLQSPDALTSCQYCPISDTDTILAAVGVSYTNRWRDFAIMWAFIIFNIAAAIFLYWLLRVPKTGSIRKQSSERFEALELSSASHSNAETLDDHINAKENSSEK